MEHQPVMMDLFEATQKVGCFPEVNAAKLIRQVYHGIQHCLSVGILHRDIKDENVLVNLKTNEVSFHARKYSISSDCLGVP